MSNSAQNASLAMGTFQGPDQSSHLVEQEPLLTNDTIAQLLNEDSKSPNETTKTEPDVTTPLSSKKFQPKATAGQAVASASSEKTQVQTEDSNVNLDHRIRQIEDVLQQLKVIQNGVKLGAATNKPPVKLNFDKINEADVYDLNIPIEAITHELPDTMLLDLKDPAYVGRWVSVNQQRLGAMLAMGFTYITEKDFATSLKLAIGVDENGHYRYNDVVAMKMQKEKYFGALRKNYLRSIAMTNTKEAARLGKRVAEQELINGRPGDAVGLSDPHLANSNRANDYAKYVGAGKLEVYIPGEMGGI